VFASLSKAFSAFSGRPFNYIWASLLFLLFLAISLLASFALFLIYFMAASALNFAVDLSSVPTIVVIAIVAFIFLFLAGGFNGALALAYRKAVAREKMSLVEFYTYGIRSSLKLFTITLLRDIVWLLCCAPIIILYVYVLSDYELMDILTAIILLAITFVIHALFTPALISAGSGGFSIYNSLRQGFSVLRRKHIDFLATYSLFALTWVLNFVPLVNLFTIFFAFPVAYSALCLMVEGQGGSGKTAVVVKEEE